MPTIMLKNKKIIRLFGQTTNFYTVGPFQTSGGWWTPIYPDIRKVFTKPGNLETIADEMIKIIRKEKIKCDLICGCATAGMPIATMVAHKLKKPFIYVRKKLKKGGLGVAVEGNWQAYKKGARVLLIDDATANGTSKKFFVKNLRDVGLTVSHLLVMGKRNSPGSDRWSKKFKITIYAMCTIDDFAHASHKAGKLSEAGLRLLIWYENFPNKWHLDKGKMKFARQYYKSHKKGSHKA